MSHTKRTLLTLIALVLVFGSQQVVDAAQDKLNTVKSTTESNIPIIVEADELFFSDASGELFAHGNVIIQKNIDTLQSDSLKGNTKLGEVWTEGAATIMRPGLNVIGQKLRYNYQDRTGGLNSIQGKVDKYLVKGQTVTINPTSAVINQGSLTGCPAEVPDYHISATKVEIWPGQKMIAYNAKFWIGKTVIFSLPKYQKSLKKLQPGEKSELPRISYSSANGIGIGQYLEVPLTNSIAAFADVAYNSKVGFKPSYGLVSRNPGYTAQMTYANEKNSDDEWLKKEPEFSIAFTPRQLGTSGINANVTVSAGKWTEGNIKGWRNSYNVYFSKDPIPLSSKLSLTIGTGYEFIHYGYDNSRNSMFRFDTTVNFKPHNRFDSWVAYYYRDTSGVSPYKYDRIDINRELGSGFMYKLDRLNSIGATMSYDLGGKYIKDIDYTWRRNLHCWEIGLTYREKRNQFKVSMSTVTW